MEDNNRFPSAGRPEKGKEPAQQGNASITVRPQKGRRMVPAMLVLCLLLATATVLLVPLLVGGASPSSSKTRTMTVSSAPAASVSYSSYEAAMEELGFVPVLPSEVPKGYALSAIRVVNGTMLELEYSSGRNQYLFRTARGKDDLSGDLTEYAHTLTEEKAGVARTYSGVAEKKLNLAVWASGDYTYAVVAPGGMDKAAMKLVAESVA